MLRDAAFTQALCADEQGFSLHAAVRYAAEDRQALEQLCRTITRSALANERVQINSVGQVVLRLKTPWRDSSTHIVMSPLEFMPRLAAWATEVRPAGARGGNRLHRIRCRRVLAPDWNPTLILPVNVVSHLAFTRSSYRQISINAFDKVAP